MRMVIMLWLCCLSGCLTSCVSHGSRRVEINFLGQQIVVVDHTENDETGKPNFQVTFDDWGKKAIDALFGWLKPKPPPTEAEIIQEADITITPQPIMVPPSKTETLIQPEPITVKPPALMKRKGTTPPPKPHDPEPK